jgi:predicted Zn-dependent protease
LKKTLLLLAVCMGIVSSSAGIAYAATLGKISYWYSDKDIISRWSTKRYVWAGMMDKSITTSAFASYVSHAMSQWRTAGISSDGVDEKSDANINIYGGTYNTLKAMEPSLSSSNTGLTVYDGTLTYEGDWQYGTSLKKSYKIGSPVNVYIVQIDGKTSNGYKKTTTHEFGHALGWRGHSSNSNDVMYGTASEVTTLTSRDKNHLVQIY